MPGAVLISEHAWGSRCTAAADHGPACWLSVLRFPACLQPVLSAITTAAFCRSTPLLPTLTLIPTCSTMVPAARPVRHHHRHHRRPQGGTRGNGRPAEACCQCVLLRLLWLERRPARRHCRLRARSGATPLLRLAAAGLLLGPVLLGLACKPLPPALATSPTQLQIFQRMTTYAKYTIAMTFRICFTFGLLTVIYNWWACFGQWGVWLRLLA